MAKHKISITKLVKKERGELVEETKKVEVSTLNGKLVGKIKQEKLKEIMKFKFSYCRKCGQLLDYEKFMSTTNKRIDSNGYLSVCTTCVNRMLKEEFSVYGDYYKALFLICKDLDLKYDESCVSEMIEYIKQYPSGDTPFTKYWKQIRLKNRTSSFRFDNTEIDIRFNNMQNSKLVDSKGELLIKWGKFSDEDYTFLENKLKEYTDSFGANSPAEIDAFKQLAILLLRARADPANKDVATALQGQWKLCGISPEQLRKENKDKNAKILGVDIATMELTDPVDYIIDKKLYFDYDGLNRDKQDILRAQKNHLTGSKDFNSDGVDISDILNSSNDIDE